jgi:hypothetical protein
VKVAKKAHEDSKTQMKKQKGEVNKLVDGSDQCTHCNKDPCVFIQIESRLCENDEIYFEEDHYVKVPVWCNSGRRKRVYQYAAFVLWEAITTCCCVIACAAYHLCLSILSWLIVVWSLQRSCRLALKPGCKEYVIRLVRFTSLNIRAKGGGRAAKILWKVESTCFGQRC